MRKGLIINEHTIDMIDLLQAEEKAELWDAIISFYRDGDLPETSRNAGRVAEIIARDYKRFTNTPKGKEEKQTDEKMKKIKKKEKEEEKDIDIKKEKDKEGVKGEKKERERESEKEKEKEQELREKFRRAGYPENQIDTFIQNRQQKESPQT